MRSFYKNNIISVLYNILIFFLVDIDISTCKFVQLINNNYVELITETDIPSDNSEHNNFILHSSNDTENVDTFQSDIGTYINNKTFLS